MTDSETASAAMRDDRQAWVRYLRGVNERQEDALAPVFDDRWGKIQDDHRAFGERFLLSLPPGGRVLDAPCGTGKYFGMVVESGRSLLGVDHAGAHLASARAKFAAIPTEKLDLQDLPYRDEFDGVMCVDAMEMIPPEDWPVVLQRFRRALRPGGWLYLTVELQAEDKIRRLNEESRRSGLPVVDGEVISRPEDWARAAREEHAPGPETFFHYYPHMEQVRAWIADAGFEIQDEAEGLWHDGGYAYHHVLSRAEAVSRQT
jgi:cyclopropane fatty-acyl-phospholipid synthase-like methyltransferase